MTNNRIEQLEKVIVDNPYDLDALNELYSIYSDSASQYYDEQKAKEVLKRINKDLSLEMNGVEEILSQEDEDTYSAEERVIIKSNDNLISEDVIKYVRKRNYFGIIIFIVDIVLIIAILCVIFMQSLTFRNNDQVISGMTEAPTDALSISVNNMSELDETYKQDVYSLRKHYVEQSMFNSPDYTPSETVFGGIQDRKFWYGTENFICYDSTKDAHLRAVGVSYVSRLINNPSFLIGVDMPYVWNIAGDVGNEYRICKNPRMLFIPQKISYSKELNLITAELDVDKMVINKDLKYMMTGMNARDLGYNYGYIYNYKNIRFANSDYNASKDIYEFRDYIGVGSSCGIEGGCNNLCPMQDELMFYFGDEQFHEFDGEQAIIDFKLWKERPRSIKSRPDIYYRIIFNKRSKWKK